MSIASGVRCGPGRLLGDPSCTVSIANVHYDEADPTKGPASFTCEVVPYELGPFSYAVGRDGPSRSICYQVPGDQGPYLVDSVVGVGNFSNPIHSYPAPHRYPDNPNLICLEASLHTLCGPAMPGRFAQTSRLAKISCNYGKPTWDPIGTEWSGFLGFEVPWCYVEIEEENEQKINRVSDNDAGDEVKNVRFNFPVVTYRFHRTMVPGFVDYDGIAAGLVGKVNSGTWFGKAAQTVRMESYMMREEDRDPAGNRVFTFSSTFKWRPYSWNYEPRPGYFRTWSRVTDAAGQSPYDTANFLPLLQYGLV